MGLVNPGNLSDVLGTKATIGEIRKENRRRRLEVVFGEKGLEVKDIVKAIGKEEIEKEVQKLEAQKNDLDLDKVERMSVKELQDEIKNVKAEYEKVVAEMHEMREKHHASSNIEVDNLSIMLKDIVSYNEKLEKDVKHFTEELDRVKIQEKELKEKIYIARNEEEVERQKHEEKRAQQNGGAWGALRNGQPLSSMADMRRNNRR